MTKHLFFSQVKISSECCWKRREEKFTDDTFGEQVEGRQDKTKPASVCVMTAEEGRAKNKKKLTRHVKKANVCVGM
jgi:hypothetical protein